MNDMNINTPTPWAIPMAKTCPSGLQLTPLPVDGFECVMRLRHPAAGLNAIIAVHDTTLGPAAGGCRMHPYATFEAALDDVKKLARGMTYKNALAGLPFGGGKSVIIGDPKTGKRDAMWRAFAEGLNELNGRYWTAEDVGTTPDDMRTMHQTSPFVTGMNDPEKGNGDPSPYTAYGVFCGIGVAVRYRLRRPNLDGVRVCILGLGNVGSELARLLHNAGAHLIVADIDAEKVARAVERYGALPVPVADTHAHDADVFAPCALGGSISPATVDQIRASIVAGAANNQLSAPEMADRLARRNILYAPDYVINAGGVIRVCNTIRDIWDEQTICTHIEGIGERLHRIFSEASEKGLSTDRVARQMAQRILSGEKPQSANAQG